MNLETFWDVTRESQDFLYLVTDDFRTTWTRWFQHRKEIRKPLTERSIRMQLKMLASLGTLTAIEQLNLSIMSGWAGVFKPLKSCGMVGTSARIQSKAGKYEGL